MLPALRVTAGEKASLWRQGQSLGAFLDELDALVASRQLPGLRARVAG
jgi:hypothetical protein